MALFEVVKYDGEPGVFAWKYPNEELGTWTQLIVNESQEAVLFKEGRALDTFQSGRHKLETANIPFLRSIINIPFGGRSPFTAEVWFINKVDTLDIKWGTPSPIQLQDPKYSVFVPIRARGQFGICIDNAKKFLVKLVGNLKSFDKITLSEFFKGLYLTKAKDAISTFLIHNNLSVLEVNTYLDEMSEFIQQGLEPIFDDYGIKLLNFSVYDLSLPEDDSAVIKLKSALAQKAEMDIIGYDYQQGRTFDVLEGAANNSGGMSGLLGAGLGIRMGAAIGDTVSKQFSETMKVDEKDNQESRKCPYCDAEVLSKTAKFCSECGKPFERVCPKCGAKIEKETAKFCVECGQKLN